ncbi:ABC transporter permease [Gryllotalpicola reticulitermitis]|uniref:ABC transporter permease n=1 Tax=Gryllotalpicola reticulitermitis TaxID=1184153 RepID=A0ABV8Q7P6_9MICO
MTEVDSTLEPSQIPEEERTPEQQPGDSDRWRDALTRIFGGNIMLSVLAIVIALVVGGILIAATDPATDAASAYFFARPTTALADAWNAVSGAYAALFRGGVYDYTQTSFVAGVKPIFNSLNFAAPLIAAGLGIAIGFRTGVFNIGGQGQILIAAAFAGWVGFSLHLPYGIHLIVAVAAALVGGGIWAGIVGVLKTRTGAHEVIVTIMLNYVAYYLIDYLLHTPVLRAPGSQNPQSPATLPTAVYPNLFGSSLPLNLGFVFTVAATVFTWWLLNRSSLGFKFRAVGENMRAAKVAGINTDRVFIVAMVLSGVFVGLAGAYQVLAQTTTGFGNDIDAGIGFNAITVTLLGRSRPWGVFWSGILFGVFQAGGYIMQASQNVDIDIVTVVQSVIVLFIAAPPLVRAIFRLPQPGARRAVKGANA